MAGEPERAVAEGKQVQHPHAQQCWQHIPGLSPLQHYLADEYEPERLVPRKRGLFSRDCEQVCCL